MKYLDTIERRLLADPNMGVPGFFEPLLRIWQQHKAETEDAFPSYSRFDVLDIPPRLISHLILCKLIGTPRRFFYEVVGEAIESHNGFPAAKRFLADVPLKNKKVMAREFGLTVLKRSAIFSRGPYIGQNDYVKEIERLICPYRIDGETFAFVTLARFALDETAMRDATLRVDRLMGVGLHKSV
ncbi:hypothetical protein [Nisaea sediminum]|uniref:hypothetical protein n=1 Tax=Nisaea sediminum TaxID=2775867 RepID=UPI001866A57B|nr:hypothetical protein [Nisaea sediminum]